MSSYNMWPILHSRPRGTPSSSGIPLTTGEEVPLQVIFTDTVSSPSLGRVDDDLAIIPPTAINMESCDQIAVRSTDDSEHVVYSVPRREPPSASSFTVAPFARTASGCFNDADNDGSGSSSSMSSVHGPRRLLGWLKRTYFVFPWNYFWLFLAVMTILLWLGFVVTFFLIIHGHFLPDRSDIEHMETVLKPHFSSHMVRRDLSTVNISAIPVPDGIVWDKVMFDIYGPTELIQIPYVLKLSMNDIVIPGIVSDDWDVKTVDSMLTDLQYYTVYDDEDAYQFRDNHGDMFCYNYYGHHFIHKASSPTPMFNYVQWEHCSTPPQGSSKTYYDKFAYFSGHDQRNAKSYYFKVAY
ncbi:hypothetical protein NDU88_008211 [Pleurodeles waltl]|uniref:Uncharacterized protein n=1 Tax=Pleurodeles waltl TaxID=8319 RepID=A0AAV7PNM7_PLEWA|nr:hypothetical protein NDU88_008211 [Pleurodeles waltl]